MRVIYYGDIRSDWNHDFTEIVMVGSLHLKDGEPTEPNELVRKDYVDKLRADLTTDSIVSGEIRESVFPAFTGDIRNKKGSRTFNMINLVTPGRYFHPKYDKNGRVIGGDKNFAPPEETLDKIPFSKIVYEKYATIGHPDNKNLSIKDFVTGTGEIDRVLSIYDPNLLNKPIKVLKATENDTAVLNKPMINELIKSSFGDVLRAIHKEGINGKDDWTKTFCSIVDHGGKPWQQTRNTSKQAWSILDTSTVIASQTVTTHASKARGNILVTKDSLYSLNYTQKSIKFNLNGMHSNLNNSITEDLQISSLYKSDPLDAEVVVYNNHAYLMDWQGSVTGETRLSRINFDANGNLTSTSGSKVFPGPNMEWRSLRLVLIKNRIYAICTVTSNIAYCDLKENGDPGSWVIMGFSKAVPNVNYCGYHSEVFVLGGYLYVIPGMQPGRVDSSVSLKTVYQNNIIYRILISGVELSGEWEIVRLNSGLEESSKTVYVSAGVVYLFSVVRSGINGLAQRSTISVGEFTKNGDLSAFIDIGINLPRYSNDTGNNRLKVVSYLNRIVLIWGKQHSFIITKDGRNDYLPVFKSDYLPDGVCFGTDLDGPLFVSKNDVIGKAWRVQKDFTVKEVRSLGDKVTPLKTEVYNTSFVYGDTLVSFNPSTGEGISYSLSKFTGELQEGVNHGDELFPLIDDYAADANIDTFIFNEKLYLIDKSNSANKIWYIALDNRGNSVGGWRTSDIEMEGAFNYILYQSKIYFFSTTGGESMLCEILRDGSLFNWTVRKDIDVPNTQVNFGSEVFRVDGATHIIPGSDPSYLQSGKTPRQLPVLSSSGHTDADKFDFRTTGITVREGIKKLLVVNGTAYIFNLLPLGRSGRSSPVIIVASLIIKPDKQLGGYDELFDIDLDGTYTGNSFSVVAAGRQIIVTVDKKAFLISYDENNTNYVRESSTGFTENKSLTESQPWTSSAMIGYNNDKDYDSRFNNGSFLMGGKTNVVEKFELTELLTGLKIGVNSQLYVNNRTLTILNSDDVSDSIAYELMNNGQIDNENVCTIFNLSTLPHNSTSLNGKVDLISSDLKAGNVGARLRYLDKSKSSKLVSGVVNISKDGYIDNNEMYGNKGWIFKEGNNVINTSMDDIYHVTVGSTTHIFDTKSKLVYSYDSTNTMVDAVRSSVKMDDNDFFNHKGNVVFNIGEFIYVLPGYTEVVNTEDNSVNYMAKSEYIRIPIVNDKIIKFSEVFQTNSLLPAGPKEVILSGKLCIVITYDIANSRFVRNTFSIDGGGRLYNLSLPATSDTVIKDVKKFSVTISKNNLYILAKDKLLTSTIVGGLNHYYGEVDDRRVETNHPWVDVKFDDTVSEVIFDKNFTKAIDSVPGNATILANPKNYFIYNNILYSSDSVHSLAKYKLSLKRDGSVNTSLSWEKNDFFAADYKLEGNNYYKPLDVYNYKSTLNSRRDKGVESNYVGTVGSFTNRWTVAPYTLENDGKMFGYKDYRYLFSNGKIYVVGHYNNYNVNDINNGKAIGDWNPEKTNYGIHAQIFTYDSKMFVFPGISEAASNLAANYMVCDILKGGLLGTWRVKQLPGKYVPGYNTVVVDKYGIMVTTHLGTVKDPFYGHLGTNHLEVNRYFIDGDNLSTPSLLFKTNSPFTVGQMDALVNKNFFYFCGNSGVYTVRTNMYQKGVLSHGKPWLFMDDEVFQGANGLVTTKLSKVTELVKDKTKPITPGMIVTDKFGLTRFSIGATATSKLELDKTGTVTDKTMTSFIPPKKESHDKKSQFVIYNRNIISLRKATDTSNKVELCYSKEALGGGVDGKGWTKINTGISFTGPVNSYVLLMVKTVIFVISLETRKVHKIDLSRGVDEVVATTLPDKFNLPNLKTMTRGITGFISGGYIHIIPGYHKHFDDFSLEYEAADKDMYYKIAVVDEDLFGEWEVKYHKTGFVNAEREAVVLGSEIYFISGVYTLEDYKIVRIDLEKFNGDSETIWVKPY